MPRKVSIPYHLEASAGAEGDVTVYTVDAAKKFKTKSVYISFPAGTYFELELTVKRGISQIAPYQGNYVGDNQVIEDEFIEDISSGERVIIHYKNTNSTQAKEAFIIIRGELE